MKSILPEALGSIPTPSSTPIGSGGAKAKADESDAPPKAGPQRGAAGAVATPSAEVEARRKATCRSIGLPEAAASLVPLLGSALVIRTASRFDADGFDSTEYSATMREDPSAIEAARLALAPWLAPITRDDAMSQLADLAVVTKRRAGDDESDELTIAAYARRLTQYPPDVVAYVLGNYTGVFWPAWAELQPALDRRVRVRRAFARALGIASE